MLSQSFALGLTLLVEAPIVLAASRHTARGEAWRIATALLPSCLTHPFAWHTIGNFGAHDYLAGMLLIELIVVAAEAALIWGLLGLRVRVAVAISFFANLGSALVGWTFV